MKEMQTQHVEREEESEWVRKRILESYEDIAKGRGRPMDEVFDELESRVKSVML